MSRFASTIARSKNELKEWGDLVGLKPGPRTMNEIRAMGAQQILWEEAWNEVEYNKALTLPAKLKEGQEVDAQWRNKGLWNDTTKATPEEAERIRQALTQFTETFPQLIQSRKDNEVVLLYLKDRNQEVTFANLQAAFESLALRGEVWINPSRIACGSESEVTGSALTRHRNFEKLIQPQQRSSVSYQPDLSAKQYLAEHEELQDKRVPFLVQQRNAKAEATAAYLGQAESSTAKGGSTTVTDYPDDQTGYPSHPTKHSFRRLLDSLDSVQYARRLNEDPSFAAAIDKMDNGNK
jgi:hypothetical protein